MIADISVSLKLGEFTSKQHLHELMSATFVNSAPVSSGLSSGAFQDNEESLKKYFDEIRAMSVYSCILSPSSQAWFLWGTQKGFEIIVETNPQGHLIRSVEAVVQSLMNLFAKQNWTVEFKISLKSLKDDQEYITGHLNSHSLLILEALKDNFYQIGIGIAGFILASLGFKGYREEATVVLISTTVFALGELLFVLWRASKILIYWRIKHD